MRKNKVAFLAFLMFSLTLFLSGCGVTNQPPSASLSANPTSGNASLEVTFDAANSSDPDGSIISYGWDFDDGSTGSGETLTHTYDSAGDYTVELTVIDNDGATDSTNQTIDVSSPPSNPPTASFTANPTSGEVPLDVAFDASSSLDSDGNITSYEWDFDDGSTGSGVTVNHTFYSSGTYNIELTVTDNDGVTDSTNKSISVQSSSDSDIDYRVTAEELMEEFDENEVAADMKYDGTTVAITGKVTGFSSSFGNYVYLGEGFCSIHCDFPESRTGEIAELSKGDHVTIVGDYDNVSICSPFFENCYVE